MQIKDKILLLIAMDDYEANNPGYLYKLEFEENGITTVTFYDYATDPYTLLYRYGASTSDDDDCRWFNDPKLFFQAVREIVYEV